MTNIQSWGLCTTQKGATIHYSVMRQGNTCQEALYPRLSATDHRMVQEVG
jgi:hypothetical protein